MFRDMHCFLGTASEKFRCLAYCTFLCFVVCGGWSSSAFASSTAEQRAQVVAEARLVEILAQIERRQINEAFRAVTELTQEIPTFRAAQLLYADLLRLRTGGVPIGEELARSQANPSKRNMGVADQNIGPQEFYKGLQNELQRRRQAAMDLPPPGMIPSNFLHLGPNVRHAIAVDTSRSRLYVFSNGPKGMELVSNFYVTIGRNGVHKRAEGDQRTPLGMYFVGRQIPGERLPDLYGKGALTVNYPNDWDRQLGRTGSGIWLHGVPSDQFARVPQASDGCVVLSNPDIAFLMDSIDRRTPVLIVEKLNWVSPQWSQQQQQQDNFMQQIAQWQTAWRQADTQRLGTLYSAELTGTEELAKRRSKLSAFGPLAKLEVNDVSVYDWQEEAGAIRIVNFQVTKGATTTVRQYWRKLEGKWQIFSEDILG